MSEVTPSQLEAINNALTEILEEYTANNKIIFNSDAERAGQHFSGLKQRLKEWKKSCACIVPQCKEKAISRSHTIPKQLSLSSIAENGHLLTPELDHKCGTISLQSIGINLASTFPGFCSTHEQLFQKFEGSEKLDNERDFYLQSYRAACRERFRSSLIIDQYNRMISKYNSLRDERLASLVAKKLRASGINEEVIIDKLHLKTDPHVLRWKDTMDSAREHADFFANRVLPAFEKAIFNNDISDVCIDAVTIDVQIPVALSGAATFNTGDNETKNCVTLIISILPRNGNSLLILGGLSSDQNYMKAYLAKWMTNAINMLSMVESWMVNGSDQWYITPSVWQSIPQKRQDAILSAMQACKQNIGQEYGLSIFDELRSRFLGLLATNKSLDREEYRRFAEAQRAKMI